MDDEGRCGKMTRGGGSGEGAGGPWPLPDPQNFEYIEEGTEANRPPSDF